MQLIVKAGDSRHFERAKWALGPFSHMLEQKDGNFILRCVDYKERKGVINQDIYDVVVGMTKEATEPIEEAEVYRIRIVTGSMFQGSIFLKEEECNAPYTVP